ncbi:MAG: M23 family metallopeptidase [Clostridia bacterium]|nr:M23 family metallopeptidase [Clostridia bacterium]
MGELVYDKTMGDYRTHNGIDIECEVGAQVACFGNGKVEKVYNDELYGNCVVISHEDGIVSVYKGLDRGITLTEGAEIKAGDIIGAAGGTNIMENEEVPHIHFEVMKDGQYIDPLGMIK